MCDFRSKCQHICCHCWHVSCYICECEYVPEGLYHPERQQLYRPLSVIRPPVQRASLWHLHSHILLTEEKLNGAWQLCWQTPGWPSAPAHSLHNWCLRSDTSSLWPQVPVRPHRWWRLVVLHVDHHLLIHSQPGCLLDSGEDGVAHRECRGPSEADGNRLWDAGSRIH